MPVHRDAAGAIVDQREHLRIISTELWTAVQERLSFASDWAQPLPIQQLALLRRLRGQDGHQRRQPRAYYRCEGHAKRGVCKNRLSVRERRRTGILDELRHQVLSEQGIAYARKRLGERLGDSREQEAELRSAKQRLDRLLHQIDKLVNFIAERRGTAAVAEKLRGLERTADAERFRIGSLEKSSSTAVPLPAPDDLLGIVFDLEKRLLSDAARGREELQRIFRDGRITLVPQPGGVYIAGRENPPPGPTNATALRGEPGRAAYSD